VAEDILHGEDLRVQSKGGFKEKARHRRRSLREEPGDSRRRATPEPEVGRKQCAFANVTLTKKTSSPYLQTRVFTHLPFAEPACVISTFSFGGFAGAKKCATDKYVRSKVVEVFNTR